MVEGDMVSRCEVFDEADLDAAITRFEQLSQPTRRLENAASRLTERLNVHFAARDWDAMTETMAEDLFEDDRRRVVGAGVRHGRDAVIANVRAVADVGCTDITSTVIATRGARLVLSRDRFSIRDQRTEAFHAEVLGIIEIDANERIVGRFAFDPDNIDAAFAELDARYLAGEAAPYAEAWRTIMDGARTLNRHEPGAMTQRITAFADHRRIPFAAEDIGQATDELWALVPDARYRVAAVHALDTHGAVINLVVEGTNVHGNELQWSVTDVISFVSGQVRLEVYAENDLDVALARFEELRPQTRRLENAATRVYERLHAQFTARDWDGITEILADDYYQHDRRPVVGGEIRRGRGSLMEDLRAAAGLGITEATSDAIATRGERLTLTRVRYSRSHEGPEAYRADLLQIVDIDVDERIMALVAFDPDDIGAAFEELDARYLAGEATAYAHTWSVIADAYATVNRRELFATTPDFVNVDHRHVTTMAPGDGIAYLRASWDLAPKLSVHIESVHRLNDLGAVFTHTAKGSSQDGFEAEWRAVDIMTVRGDLISCGELFDETDIDAAIGRFEELSEPVPQLENAASRVYGRLQTYFAARDWDAMAAMLGDGFTSDDRRRVVGAGVRHGPDAAIEDSRAIADVGFTNMSTTVIAIRGQRLAVTRAYYSGPDQGPEAFHAESLGIVEIDAAERIAAIVVFELDEFDAAIAELDARYLAGEAAAHAHTWSVITGARAALVRHELPATTPDWVNLDHRRGIAFAPGDMTAYFRAVWDLERDFSTYIEAVHRLNSLGAVFTQVARGTSQAGFDAEWRIVEFMTVEGDLIKRAEVFDEADIGAALTRFEELDRPAPRLVNAASQATERWWMYLNAHDWDAMAELTADDISTEDRRRVVNSGTRHGRDAEMANMRAMADLGANVTSTVIAIRGERLALSRVLVLIHDQGAEAFRAEGLGIVEIDAHERIVARVMVDLDDVNAAFEELDTRYVAGESAAHAHTWSVIAGTYAAFNRHGLVPDWVSVDHRRGSPFASNDLNATIRASRDLTPDLTIHIETVHRLSAFGAVVTNMSFGTSDEGFAAEWRMVQLLTIDGDRITRLEIFDEDDIDAALTGFEELSRPALRLENAASRVDERVWTYFAARDWVAIAEMLAADISTDDRCRVVGAGVREGRDAELADMRVWADLGVTTATSAVIATRGAHLVLARTNFSGRDQRPDAFHGEYLGILEIGADERIVARLWFDLDDFDAALEELDARYLAGEASPHAHTWSLIKETYAALNRREMPATTPDWINVDRRRIATIEPGEMMAYLRAMGGLMPQAGIYIEAVHRLNEFGAVTTHVSHGTTRQGFDAQWRVIDLLTVHEELLTRCEIFDEIDLDIALARFEELSPTAPRLENAASRVFERFEAHFAARDWTAMAEILAEDMCNDDRRRVVGAGVLRGRDTDIEHMRAIADVGAKTITSTVIATRGERLVLRRVLFSGEDQVPKTFQAELLGIVEIDTDGRIVARVSLDVDDLDSAFAELDARYLAGEAAAHARTWSLIARTFAALNRHKLDELPATTPDYHVVDRRLLSTVNAADLTALFRATWDLTPEIHMYVEAVHLLNDRGVVITQGAHGTSQEGFDAQWRMLQVMTVAGDMGDHCELFDEADLDAALARFEELSRPARQPENAASRVDERFRAHFAARDWDAMGEMLADHMCNDDRRRVVNAGLRRGRDIEIANTRAFAELGVTDVTSDVMAIRGGRLALSRNRFIGRDQRPEAFRSELLCIVEIDADERIMARVSFDVDDIDAALEELDARYLAGEAGAHEHTWSVIAKAYAALNRRELPETTPDWVNVDHRHVTGFEPGGYFAFVRAAWDVAPDMRRTIEAVHRLNHLGAVITHTGYGTSREGFDAEWRTLVLVTVEGDLISRCELFDETDIDAVLARFDELSRPAPQLENAAIRARARVADAYNRRDVEGFLALASGRYEDRRKGLRDEGAADRNFAHAVLSETPTSWRLEIEPVAIRGDRLALSRETFRDTDEVNQPITVELIVLTDVADAELDSYTVFFDPDDIDEAFAALDARYIVGEAAAHSHTWSVVASGYADFNRRQLPPTAPDWVNIDHRRGGSAFAPGEQIAFIRASWEDTPDIRIHIEAVHRLSDLGAVVTQAVHGTSREGFEAEWREIHVVTLEGELFSGSEMFDEADIDAALARFDELNAAAPHLENAATRARARQAEAFNRRNLDGFLAGYSTAEARYEDRRKGLRDDAAGPGLTKRARALFEAPKRWRTEMEPVAIRGPRLALTRDKYLDTDSDRTITAEHLTLTEVGDDNLVHRTILFDPDDINGAIDELTARWIASGEVAHPEVIEAYMQILQKLNRHDWDEYRASLADATYVNHRQLGTGNTIADFTTSVTMLASLVPNLWVEPAEILNHSASGVVSDLLAKGTSSDGVEVEMPMVVLTLFDGDRLAHFEAFDADQRDLAVARFDELNRPA